jgi:hypothetical protein
MEVFVYSFEQSWKSSLHPTFMVFVTQVMGCRLLFKEVGN